MFECDSTEVYLWRCHMCIKPFINPSVLSFQCRLTMILVHSVIQKNTAITMAIRDVTPYAKQNSVLLQRKTICIQKRHHSKSLKISTIFPQTSSTSFPHIDQISTFTICNCFYLDYIIYKRKNKIK